MRLHSRRPSVTGPGGHLPFHIREFLHKVVRSTWGLEVLLLIRATQSTAWTSEQLSGELRASVSLVEDILVRYTRAHIVMLENEHRYRYAPKDPRLDVLIAELEELNAERPLALLKEILRIPNDKIQTFVDAFKIKKE
jgi:hypothetical protein